MGDRLFQPFVDVERNPFSIFQDGSAHGDDNQGFLDGDIVDDYGNTALQEQYGLVEGPANAQTTAAVDAGGAPQDLQGRIDVLKEELIDMSEERDHFMTRAGHFVDQYTVLENENKQAKLKLEIARRRAELLAYDKRRGVDRVDALEAIISKGQTPVTPDFEAGETIDEYHKRILEQAHGKGDARDSIRKDRAAMKLLKTRAFHIYRREAQTLEEWREEEDRLRESRDAIPDDEASEVDSDDEKARADPLVRLPYQERMAERELHTLQSRILSAYDYRQLIGQTAVDKAEAEKQKQQEQAAAAQAQTQEKPVKIKTEDADEEANEEPAAEIVAAPAQPAQQLRRRGFQAPETKARDGKWRCSTM